MIHKIKISDYIYKKLCFEKSHTDDFSSLIYDVSDGIKRDFDSFYLFYIFHDYLFRIISRFEKGKSVRIDNLDNLMYLDINGFLDSKGLVNSFVDVKRIEKISKHMAVEIFNIFDSISGGTILNNSTNINIPIMTYDGHGYITTTVDLSYFDKDGNFNLILFEPVKSTFLNIKTALIYDFFSQIFNIKNFTIYQYGTSVEDRSDMIIPFRKIVPAIDDRLISIFSKVNKNCKDTVIQTIPFFELCNTCSSRTCSKRLTVFG